MALNWLMFCVDVKRARISKLKLMPAIVQAVFPIGSEEDTEEADHKADEGDDDEEEGSPSKVAFQVMNIVAVNFPPQQVFPVVMELVTAHAQNPAVGVRKACMLSIAVIVDGCADYMRSKIDGILPFVYAGMQDGTTVVKKSACMALCSLSEELEAEVGQYHAQILPLLFQLMNEGTSQQVLTHATNALDSILESLEEEQLLPYLPSLMEKLVFLLNAPTPDLKATVVSAIGSAAHSAGDKFVPYFPVTIGAMKMLLEMCKTEDEMLLKGVTFDTIGAIAEAVGKEVFRPYMPELMQIAMQALHLNHSRLLECCYCFFSVIARVFEAEFSVYLPHIVPVVLKSCQQPELGEDDAAEEARFAAANLEVGDDAENAGARVRINSSIAEEKETAADSLGSIFAATTTAFLPYVQESTNTLKSLLEHNNDSVRSRARGSLFHFLHTIHKMSNPQEWVAGLPVQVPVHENVVSMNEIVVESVLGMMENEFDK